MGVLGIDTGYQLMQVVLLFTLGLVVIIMLGTTIRRWFKRRS